MNILKMILKLLVYLMIPALGLLQWLLIYLVGFTSFIFDFAAGALLFLAVVLILTGDITASGVIALVIAGFMAFMVPVIGQEFAEAVGRLREKLRKYI